MLCLGTLAKLDEAQSLGRMLPYARLFRGIANQDRRFLALPALRPSLPLGATGRLPYCPSPTARMRPPQRGQTRHAECRAPGGGWFPHGWGSSTAQSICRRARDELTSGEKPGLLSQPLVAEQLRPLVRLVPGSFWAGQVSPLPQFVLASSYRPNSKRLTRHSYWGLGYISNSEL